jgi:hypothetical protein
LLITAISQSISAERRHFQSFSIAARLTKTFGMWVALEEGEEKHPWGDLRGILLHGWPPVQGSYERARS